MNRASVTHARTQRTVTELVQRFEGLDVAADIWTRARRLRELRAALGEGPSDAVRAASRGPLHTEDG